MREPSPITAVVFDIGGVLVDWNPRYLYRKLLDPADMERFLSEVCTLEWHHAHDLGVPMEETAAELRRRYPDLGDLIEAWRTRWPEMYGASIAETVQLLEDLVSRGVPIHGLTNWPAEKFEGALVRFPFLRHLQPVVVSGRERVAKPDPRLFHILITRAAIDPATTLYIDDSAANAATAEDLGFVVHHFLTPGHLRSELVALGML